MTSDDKQPRSHADRPAAAASSDSASERAPDPALEGSDDLEALAGALPSVPPVSEPPAESEEELDLGALAAVGGRRPSSVGEDAPVPAPPQPSAPRPPSAPRAEAAPPATQRARAAWLMPLLIGLGLGAGVAGVVFVAMAGHDQPPRERVPGVPTASAEGSPAPPVAASAAAPAAQPIAATDPPATGSASPQLGPALLTGTTPQPAAAPEPAAQRPHPRPGTSAPAAAAQPAPSAAEAEPDTPVLAVTPAEEEAAAAKAAESASNAKGTPSSVDALLDEALAPAAQRQELAYRQQAALQEQELPLTPSREDVTRAMTVLLPAIRGCAMGNSGLATAGIVVGNDGRVVGVEITGAPFAGTASGRCMEGVIRRARFTRFRQPTLRVKFPLAIQ